MSVDLAHRVALRSVSGGFIPDKFWRAKKTELRKLMAQEIGKGDPGFVSYYLADRAVPFFKKFVEDIRGFGVHQFADVSISDRLDLALVVVNKIAKTWNELATAMAVEWPPKGLVEYLGWYIIGQIREVLEAKVKTLGDAFKYTWKTDKRLIVVLTQRVLNKATPAERDAMEKWWQDRDAMEMDASRIVYDFLKRINFYNAAKKLVSKEKITWDPIHWMDFTQQILTEVHSEEKLETFTEFELHGVKVVVDDLTVSPEQIHQYVKYMDQAHSLLKRKGLDKVWYGIFFIKCEDCGGYNQNTQKWKDVGGNYPYGPDVVNIFVRPSHFIVELLTHELGHRYWFKFMHEGQRGKFESLVKVHKHSMPIDQKPRTILESKPLAAKNHVDESVKALRASLAALTPSGKKWFRDVIKESVEPIGKAGWTFQNDMIDAVHKAGADATINPEVKHLFDEFLKSLDPVTHMTRDVDTQISDEIHKEPEPAVAPKSRDKFWNDVFARERDKWLAKLDHHIEFAVASAYIYIDAAVLAFNAKEEGRNTESWKNYNEELEKDERPVPAVSQYGTSNIAEAFAEVFAYYVIGNFLTEDQELSFKSVLKTASQRVVDAYVGRLGLR